MIASVNAPARHLRLLAEVLALVESGHVLAPHLVGLHARLAATGDTASHRIAQLTRLVDLLESRQNQIFAPVALLLLWGTQLAWAIEIWRRRSGPSLSEWIAVAGEFEALSSLAGYAFEHPGDPFPDLVGGGPRRRGHGPGASAAAGGAGRRQRRRAWRRTCACWWCRDRTCRGRARCSARSASTSSWRSPARPSARGGWRSRRSRSARRCGCRTRCRRASRGSSPRSRGSNRSSIWPTARSRCSSCSTSCCGHQLARPPARRGRHRAGAGGQGAVGLVTTHDLALAEVVSDLGVHARNVHFSDTFEDGQLRFDYRMREGVVGPATRWP